MVTNGNINSGSVPFNTLLSGSGSPFSITDSSSNFDTESTGSFFQDNITTLGSLIGVSRISIGRTKTKVLKSKKGKKSNSTSWLFCLCSRGSSNNLDIDQNINLLSLAQYLAMERKAANENRKNQIPSICCSEDEFVLAHTITESNTLFVNGTITPPRTITSMHSIGTEREKRALGYGNNLIKSLVGMFLCMSELAAFG
ncbi:PREDICTED: uncharacterized protein LOC109351593 [Lupinus angustifolius]|uniref:uncharacterized protein LOC109351593 n=1 Tax=Lupinus angustifolius TaxID=3871 RepID=UPI00092F8548|nr:PREDICTED: uncharacterized protein LOC109351593 [Lupinus angustifolius]